MKFKLKDIPILLKRYYYIVLCYLKNSDPIYTEQPSFKKLYGYSLYYIISQWVRAYFPDEHVIILTQINVQAKNLEFWAKIPKSESTLFLEDIVVLRCKDLSELQRLILNIPSEFAEAYGFSQGEYIDHNNEKDKV